jgi:hypothetical protein
VLDLSPVPAEVEIPRQDPTRQQGDGAGGGTGDIGLGLGTGRANDA